MIHGSGTRAGPTNAAGNFVGVAWMTNFSDGRKGQCAVSMTPNATAKAKSYNLFLAPKFDIMFEICRTIVCSLTES
jgi:hypothetical protein